MRAIAKSDALEELCDELEAECHMLREGGARTTPPKEEHGSMEPPARMGSEKEPDVVRDLSSELEVASIHDPNPHSN